MIAPPEPTRKAEFWAGAKATIPLEVGAIPFGIIFGALAVNSGLSPAGTVAMSALVFAGSSQFIAAGLIATGTGMALIILTTFIVNLRHALYAATLAPYMKDLPQKWLLPLGFWLTDESFVVVIQRYRQKDASPHKHWFYLGSAVFMYVNWQIWTWIGLKAGQAIQDPVSWGLDYAMVVTFLGMLIPMLKDRPTKIAVATAAVISLLTFSMRFQLGLIVTALISILAGVLAERRWPALEHTDE